MKKQSLYTLGELAEKLEVSFLGDPQTAIHSLATLKSAGPGQLSFLSNPRYINQLAACKASALIIHPELADNSPCACLLSESPYVTYAHASQMFQTRSHEPAGIHPSAVVSSSARIGADVSIAAHTVIEDDVEIGDGCIIGAGCFIGRQVRIGNNCRLYANVTLYHQVILGSDCVIHSAAVIGADGFGFAFDECYPLVQRGLFQAGFCFGKHRPRLVDGHHVSGRNLCGNQFKRNSGSRADFQHLVSGPEHHFSYGPCKSRSRWTIHAD